MYKRLDTKGYQQHYIKNVIIYACKVNVPFKEMFETLFYFFLINTVEISSIISNANNVIYSHEMYR